MPIITSLEPQKNKKRVNVYLDGKFGFGIDLENLVRLGLKVEQKLSEGEIEKIIEKVAFQKTYNKLLKFATLRPRSEKEINSWLKKYKVHAALHRNLFIRLKRLGLLDDDKFARWWIEQRMTFRPRGSRALRLELRQKGISRNTIENVLSEVEIDEEKLAKGLLGKKKYKWGKLGKREGRKKMGDFLARRGFGWGVINKVIKDLTKQ
jgi:regulatory protein